MNPSVILKTLTTNPEVIKIGLLGGTLVVSSFVIKATKVLQTHFNIDLSVIAYVLSFIVPLFTLLFVGNELLELLTSVVNTFKLM